MTDTTWTTQTASVAATIALGRVIGALLTPSDLLLLTGGLGAGKTHLSKGIAAGLGSTDMVTSPTYVFINEYHYPPRGTLFHVDLYRAENAAELASIGLEDALAGHGPCIIEWPERDPSLRTLPHLAITMQPVAPAMTARAITVTAQGPRAQQLLAAIRTTQQTEEQR